MTQWYTRPIIPVRDVAAALLYYIEVLGFAEDWRHEDGGDLLVAQVGRDGCELILSSQWPGKVGTAMQFVSLDPNVLQDLRAGLESRGVAVDDGWWGYRLTVLNDPDGNQLLFPYPAETEQ